MIFVRSRNLRSLQYPSIAAADGSKFRFMISPNITDDCLGITVVIRPTASSYYFMC